MTPMNLPFRGIEIHNNRFWNIGDSLALDTMILYEGPVWNGNATMQNHFLVNNNGDDLALTTKWRPWRDSSPRESTRSRMRRLGPAEHQPAGTFFDPVDYVGAFEPGGENWLTGATSGNKGVLPATSPAACTPGPATLMRKPTDDGSCELDSCKGCTYPSATNYTPMQVR